MLATDDRYLATGAGDKASGIIAKDELAQQNKGLYGGRAVSDVRKLTTVRISHPFRLLLRDKMASALHKDISPVPFLVNNTRELAVIIVPRR